jgi:hypothetical protein
VNLLNTPIVVKVDALTLDACDRTAAHHTLNGGTSRRRRLTRSEVVRRALARGLPLVRRDLDLPPLDTINATPTRRTS